MNNSNIMLKSKLALSRLALVGSLLFISFQVFGQDADICTKIEDPAFKDYCLQQFDSNKDGKISLEEASQSKWIVVEHEDIKSLKGIEYFVNITTLQCRYNKLTSLDVSKNTALEMLECSYNQITSLDVSMNTALTSLGCTENQLTGLDVSKNTALTSLGCAENQLTGLDVSKNTALTWLDCSSNQLTSLDVSKNTALKKLYCSNNQLTGLDVSKNTALTWLVCSSNQLTSLDVSMNTALTSLTCAENQLTSLDVSKNTELSSLGCTQNRLTSIDIRTNKKLRNMDCGDIQLIGGPLKIEDPVFKSYCLKNFDTNKDGEISETEAAMVKDIDVHEMNIRSLKGIEYFTNLTQLRCMSNQLTSLDVSKNTALEVLHCGWNQLTSLDVSKNTALRVLSCNSNELNNLDVSNATALTSLDCKVNQLTRLDLSKNTALKDLDCRRNQLTYLDISKNTNLKTIEYDGNNITKDSIKGQLPKGAPSWVYNYRWAYSTTVLGRNNVPGNRDFLIKLTDPTIVSRQVFTITITNSSPLQVDCWQRTYEGTFTYSDDGTIVLQYGSEKTILYVDYDARCLRFKQNGERLEQKY